MIPYVLIALFLPAISYLFPPETNHLTGSVLNTAISIPIVFLSAYWLFKKDYRGWLIILGEFVLGGSGNYFSLNGVSLRTTLLIVSLIIYTFNFIKNDWQDFKTNPQFRYATLGILILLLVAALGVVNGYLNQHSLTSAVSDIIPYAYLLYFFPLRRLLNNPSFIPVLKKMLPGAIIAYSIIYFFTFVGFSAGLFQVHDLYYWWWRDVVLGKTTDLGFNFYRLVMDLQLLLVPLALYYVYNIIQKTAKKIDYYLLALLLISLGINLTRVYYLAFVVGLVFLANKTYWKRYLLTSATTLLFIFSSFTSIHLATSLGKSLGWEIFGLRLQSIASPQIEESSLSRMMLLPKIWEKIKTNPIIGEGLGATITAFSPIAKTTITTPHFDWGYLEIWTELGMIGLIIWITLIVLIAHLIIKNKKSRFLLSALVALLVINLTSPALFHVLGVMLLAYLLSTSFTDQTKLSRAS
ncbi:MAG TPA: O-antigen ligase family protein [Patescibacteria group bacterium]|nr:O-antigen ligase family protein [Patescibacteria group bacterium]